MIATRLTTEERQELQMIIRQTKDANQLRRALAVLWFDEKRSVQELVRWLNISSATVYRWIEAFYQRQEMAIEEQIAEKPKGRPKQSSETIFFIDFDTINSYASRPPQDFGYKESRWTLESLTDHLNKHAMSEGTEVSIKQVEKILDDTRKHTGVHPAYLEIGPGIKAIIRYIPNQQMKKSPHNRGDE